MSDNNLNYLGPIPRVEHSTARRAWWTRVPLPFLIIVVLPTVLAAIYYLLIASPRYVSEARFIVRASNQSQPSSLGVALQGVGLSSTQTDAFAVHEYIDSRDSLNEVGGRLDLLRMFKQGADPLSGYPRFFESPSEEKLFKAYKRFITVGYDSTTGISELRVEAFNARDAQRLSQELLNGGERLVNRLNVRAAQDLVADATLARERAIQHRSEAQQALAALRNREEFIDPTLSAREGSELIGGLLATVANLRAERSQIASGAPSSPQLPTLDSRIAAYERQIAEERAKIVGSPGSLAPRIGAYEDLVATRELADREVAETTASLLTAQQDARRQKLYLDRVVNPSLPDSPTQPRRLIQILTVFMSSLLAFSIAWLVWAGVREHRQD